MNFRTVLFFSIFLATSVSAYIIPEESQYTKITNPYLVCSQSEDSKDVITISVHPERRMWYSTSTSTSNEGLEYSIKKFEKVREESCDVCFKIDASLTYQFQSYKYFINTSFLPESKKIILEMQELRTPPLTDIEKANKKDVLQMLCKKVEKTKALSEPLPPPGPVRLNSKGQHYTYVVDAYLDFGPKKRLSNKVPATLSVYANGATEALEKNIRGEFKPDLGRISFEGDKLSVDFFFGDNLSSFKNVDTLVNEYNKKFKTRKTAIPKPQGTTNELSDDFTVVFLVTPKDSKSSAFVDFTKTQLEVRK